MPRCYVVKKLKDGLLYSVPIHRVCCHYLVWAIGYFPYDNSQPVLGPYPGIILFKDYFLRRITSATVYLTCFNSLFKHLQKLFGGYLFKFRFVIIHPLFNVPFNYVCRPFIINYNLSFREVAAAGVYSPELYPEVLILLVKPLCKLFSIVSVPAVKVGLSQELAKLFWAE